MTKGPLGFPRLIGGPLSTRGALFSQNLDTTDEMQDEVAEIIDEMGIDSTTEDPEEIQRVANELAERTYPQDERRQEKLISCIASEWGNSWSEGFSGSAGQQNTPLEDLALSAGGCVGMVEANTLGDPPSDQNNEDQEEQ